MPEASKSVHKAVLLHEVVQALGLQMEAGTSFEGAPQSLARGLSEFSPENSRTLRKIVLAGMRGNQNFTYLDGTLGGAGHALAIAEALKGKLTIIGLDRDPEAIERARETLKGKAEKIILENGDFRNLDKVLQKYGIEKIDSKTHKKSS